MPLRWGAKPPPQRLGLAAAAGPRACLLYVVPGKGPGAERRETGKITLACVRKPSQRNVDRQVRASYQGCFQPESRPLVED